MVSPGEDGMSDEIIGYYRDRKEALLKEFDRTAASMNDSLVERYGMESASFVVRTIAITNKIGRIQSCKTNYPLMPMQVT